jgi:hypothetical protein
MTTLPWVAHSQLQYKHHHWVGSVTMHASQDQQKNYCQSIIQHQKKSTHNHCSIALATRFFENEQPTITLSIAQKRRNHHSLHSKITQQQQSVLAAITPKPHHKLQASLLNKQLHDTHNQQIALTAQWQDAIAKWRAHTSIPLYDNPLTWSLQAKTGLLCTSSCLVWTPLHSIQTPAMLTFDAEKAPQFFYWGSLKTLRESGLNLQKKSPYRLPKNQNKTTPDMLYPGNIILNLPDPACNTTCP